MKLVSTYCSIVPVRLEMEKASFPCRWKMLGVWWRATSTLQHVRLNSAIGYIYPKDMLTGRQQEIHAREIVSWRRLENSGSFGDIQKSRLKWITSGEPTTRELNDEKRV
jgi:hypothetical protein